MRSSGFRAPVVVGLACAIVLAILLVLLAVKPRHETTTSPPPPIKQVPIPSTAGKGQEDPMPKKAAEGRSQPPSDNQAAPKRFSNGEKPWLRVDHSKCPPHKPEDLNDYGQSIRPGDPCFCPTPGGEVIRETPFGRIIGLRSREDEPLSRITLDARRPQNEAERFTFVNTLMTCNADDTKDGLFILLSEFGWHPDSPALRQGVIGVLQTHPMAEVRVGVFEEALSGFDPVEGPFNDGKRIASHTWLLEEGLKVLPQDPDPACRHRFIASLTPNLNVKRTGRTAGKPVKPLRWALPIIRQMGQADPSPEVRAAALSSVQTIEEYLKRF